MTDAERSLLERGVVALERIAKALQGPDPLCERCGHARSLHQSMGCRTIAELGEPHCSCPDFLGA